MNQIDALSALRALSQESRLGAFRLLVQAGPAGLPVGALRDALGLPPATLSAHLNVLRAAGLAVDTRAGRVINVRADFVRMNELLGFLTENCCQGQACVPAAADCCTPESNGTTP
jgi:ArsR family transcriptional regulator